VWVNNGRTQAEPASFVIRIFKRINVLISAKPLVQPEFVPANQCPASGNRWVILSVDVDYFLTPE
jgi:hypothetical protein